MEIVSGALKRACAFTGILLRKRPFGRLRRSEYSSERGDIRQSALTGYDIQARMTFADCTVGRTRMRIILFDVQPARAGYKVPPQRVCCGGSSFKISAVSPNRNEEQISTRPCIVCFWDLTARNCRTF